MSINLLAWRERNSHIAFRKSVFRIILFATACLFFILLLQFYLLHQITVMHNKQNNIALLTKKIVLTNKDVDHQKLLKKLTLLFQKRKAERRFNLHIESTLCFIANDLPNNIVLQSLTLTSKKLIISGSSNTISDIHRYADALEKNHIGNHILLSNIHTDSHSSNNLLFTMETTL